MIQKKFLPSLLEDPRYIAAVLSILFSVIVSYHTISNPDGILYLITAEAFIEKGAMAAYSLYNWFLYSLLIGTTHALTGLSYEHAADVINAGLCALLVVFFISIIRASGGNTRTQWLAALVVLALPALNEIRDSIIRDFGYWAFQLASLWALIRYAQNPRWFDAICFILTAMIATLFRIEGAVLLILAPLFLSWHPSWDWHHRLKAIIKLYVIWMVPAVILSLLLYSLNQFPSKIGRLAEFLELGTRIYNKAIPAWGGINQALANAMPSGFHDEDTVIILLFGVSAYFIVKALNKVSLFYVGLLIIGRGHCAPISTMASRLIICFTVFNLLLPLGLLILEQFVSSRYMIPAALTASLLLPFILNNILERKLFAKLTARQYNWAQSVIVCVFIFMLADGLVSMGGSKDYIRQAGMWINQNIDKNESFISNNVQVRYYAHRYTLDNWKDNTAYSPKQLSASIAYYHRVQRPFTLVLNLKRREELSNLQIHPAALGLTEVKRFANTKGDKIVILRSQP